MSWRAGGLALVVAAGAALTYLYHGNLIEPRHAIAALVALGFFWAPDSDRPLRMVWWLPAVALTGWGARSASLGRGGFSLWAACSAAGAFLVVRGGSRANCYLLPVALSEEGEKKRRQIRRQLQISVASFFVGYLVPRALPLAVAISAAYFVRYALLQAKFQGVPSIPLSKTPGIVPAQKWVILVFFVLVGGTRYPDALVGDSGEGPLLITATLCLLLASLIFVLALVRSRWPKPIVRRTSFFAGIGVAVVLTAILAQLESWDPHRYTVFISASIFFLVVLPFLKSTTRLFDAYPRAGLLVAPPILSAMMAPVTAMNGSIWTAPSVGALYAFALLMLVYQLLVSLRERASGTLYLSLLIGSMAFLFFHRASGGSWKVFFLAFGLLLYAVDLFDRVWRNSRSHETIEQT